MLNLAAIQGRLTADPELRRTSEGTAVCSFRLACDRNGKTGTDFINCVAWQGRAELVTKYCSKGDMIVVRGRIQIRAYEKDGERREVTEIVVDDVNFANQRKREETKPVEGNPFRDIEISDADLPF